MEKAYVYEFPDGAAVLLKINGDGEASEVVGMGFTPPCPETPSLLDDTLSLLDCPVVRMRADSRTQWRKDDSSEGWRNDAKSQDFMFWTTTELYGTKGT